MSCFKGSKLKEVVEGYRKQVGKEAMIKCHCVCVESTFELLISVWQNAFFSPLQAGKLK